MKGGSDGSGVDFNYMQSVSRQWCPILYLDSGEENWPCSTDDLVRASHLVHTESGKPFVPPHNILTNGCGGSSKSKSKSKTPPVDCGGLAMPLLQQQPDVAAAEDNNNTNNSSSSKPWVVLLPLPPLPPPPLTPLLLSKWLATFAVLQNDVTGQEFTLSLVGGTSNPLVKRRPPNLDAVPLYVRWRRRHSTAAANEWYITYAHVYGYNGATSIIGNFGAHEADLEHVTMHVRTGTAGPNGSTLLAVYYSQHYGGKWVDRSAVEYQKFGRPAVYVGRASHASYSRAGTVRRFWGAALDVCDGKCEWDARNNLVFLDGPLPREQQWMISYKGDLGNGHVSSFVRQAFWNATDIEHNSGTGFCFSTH